MFGPRYTQMSHECTQGLKELNPVGHVKQTTEVTHLESARTSSSQMLVKKAAIAVGLMMLMTFVAAQYRTFSRGERGQDLEQEPTSQL